MRGLKATGAALATLSVEHGSVGHDANLIVGAQTCHTVPQGGIKTFSHPYEYVHTVPRGGGDSPSDRDKNYPGKRESVNGKNKKKGQTLGEKQESTSSSASGSAVDNVLSCDDFYEVLGVGQASSDAEIKKAYRRRAVQTHPDKTGGDRRAFDKVAEAYGVLADKKKRAIYDRFGKVGLENADGDPSPSPYGDIFSAMFQHQRTARARRNRTVRYQLQVTLEDMYNGSLQTVTVSSPKSKLNTKKVEVHIPRGAISGQSVLMSGEIDFDEHDAPGDLIFVLTQAPHASFTRKGHDLAMELTITLEEAICGFQRPLIHLDGTEVWVQSATVKDVPALIQTGDVQVLKGKGMPRPGSDNAYGDLYIQFRVETTKLSAQPALTDDEHLELRRLLRKLQGKPGIHTPDDNAEALPLRKAVPSDFGRLSGNIDVGEDDFQESNIPFHPFGSGFFSTGQNGAAGYFGSFGGPQFGQPGDFGSDEGNVQCQQM